jgi:hypothetical protein
MAGGCVKGTGHTHNRFFWHSWRATSSAATIDTRRAETRSGSAAPRAQESVTRPAEGAAQNIHELIYKVQEDERLTRKLADVA